MTLSTIPATLLTGYESFRKGRYSQEVERFRQAAAGQAPKTMIIGCADSRVDPATIFSAGPGELFVVRNVAALVPPFESEGKYHGTSAAIEFAVTGLKVENLVVLGHGLCGGVTAALNASHGRPVGQFIGPWVGLLAVARDLLIEHSIDASQAERQRALEHLAVQQSLENLLTFPFIADAVQSGRLRLHGSWFSIAEGSLRWLNPETGEFQPVLVPAG